MKVLLFLNGPDGWQLGIEDGFTNLHLKGLISELKWFYFEEFVKSESASRCILKMHEIAIDFLPDLIIFFHIGRLSINKKFIIELKNIESKPLIVYDEGDMYGGFSKPITKSMKLMFRFTDFVSIRGLGKWYMKVRKFNQNVLYVPHSNSLLRFSEKLHLNKNKEIIFIGNKVSSRLGQLRRLSGAYEREKYIIEMAKHFPNQISIYGKGWDNLNGYKGKLDFLKQIDVCQNAYIHISYEHYPEIPYYFSDRLPIALSAGQIYVCHYHVGYEDMFKNCDFIYFFKTTNEAIDIINYLFSLSNDELNKKSKNAKEFSNRFLSPNVVWQSLLERIVKK